MALAAFLIGPDGDFLGLTIDSFIADRPKGPATKVAVGVGKDGQGCVPDISLWDANGERIGQRYNKPKFHPRKARYQPEVFDDAKKGSRFFEIEIPHTQTTPPKNDTQAEYIMIHAAGGEPICITDISVKGSDYDWVWFGDSAKMCQHPWFPGERKMGSNNYSPACIWMGANPITTKPVSDHLSKDPKDPSIRRYGSTLSVFISTTSAPMKHESYSLRKIQRRCVTANHAWDSGSTKEETT